MTSQPVGPNNGHLAYYERHGISPVHYNIQDLAAHFDRRDSLYRSLGLPPAAFRGSRVIEVAPGSGQNSLYVAACLPAALDLVEPNSTGIRDIRAAYASFQRPHTTPQLHTVRFETFETMATYDIVLCENWLGSQPHELALIRKLASMVAPGGVLVLTVVPLSGFFPNVMRRLLALRIIEPNATFEQKTDQALEAFSPHLSTIADMTRSHRDWVHDCMLNPHYLNVALSFDAVLEAVGPQLEALATFPRFTADWRWFKSLIGSKRQFSETTLVAYLQNLHNFVDYREAWPSRSVTQNTKLNDAFVGLHRVALAWQTAAAISNNDNSEAAEDIVKNLSEIGASLAEVDPKLGHAIHELKSVWEFPKLDVTTVRDMHMFKSLFGRETIYLSLTRVRDL